MSIFAPFAFQAEEAAAGFGPWNGTFGTGFNNTTTFLTRNNYDGGLIICGSFTTYKGNTALRIVKLDINGTQQTLDTTGTTFASNATRCAAVDTATGRLFAGAQSSTYFRAWDAAGVEDTGWPTFNGAIVDMKINGGYLYCVGNFTTVNGNTTYGNFVRINLTTKAVDASYTYLTKTVSNANEAWYIDFDTANDRMYVGGPFTTIDSVGIRFLYKIVLSTGARDTSWVHNQLVRTTSTSLSFSPVVQSDGKVMVGGAFLQKVVSGVTSNGYNIARLNADGTVDTGYNIPTAGELGFGTRTIGTFSTGKYLFPGNFSSTQLPYMPGWVGTNYNQNGFIRIDNDGDYDATLYYPTAMGVTVPTLSRRSVTNNLIQSDDTFICTSAGNRWQNSEVTNYIYAMNADGTLRTSAYL